MEASTLSPPFPSARLAEPSAAATTAWKALYRGAGVAALLSVLVIPLQVVVFAVWPPPEGTALEWFALFQESRLLGLLSLDLLMLIDYALLIPIILALCAALRRVSEPLAALGGVLFFAAIAGYFASNTMVEMMTLSSQYAAATTEEMRAMYAAAGQAMLATYEGTAFHVSYILGSLAGIVLSALMLRDPAFGKIAGWAGILGNIVGFGLYIPEIGLILSVLSGPVLWVWYMLVARGLFRLAAS